LFNPAVKSSPSVVATALACCAALARRAAALGRDDGIELSKQLKALGIPVLLISGQVSRASSAKTVAIGSMPKPYDAAEMVLAVAFLLARLDGDASLPRPPQLEVLDEDRIDLAPAP
jgi:two-component system, response regulator PdtaR